jgi:MFS family permease
MPGFIHFVRDNARWLAGGFLLTFFSSYGQTFFIALSAGDIRFEYGLSHGEFGGLYLLATLASAATLPFLGQIVDRLSPRAVTIVVVPMLAFAAMMMAFSQHILLLLLALYLLRLFGQGMMTQNAATAIARWFVAQRGRAMSVTVIGVNAGEAVFPFAFVVVAALVGWRNAWLLGAATLVLVALPLIAGLVRVQRAPRASDPPAKRVRARDWTRREVLRDPYFYLTMAGVLAPGFIGTTIFFHQVYLVELRGWSLEVFATSFAFMAAMTVTCALLAGQLIDRFSSVGLLPSFLFPLALACLVLGLAEGQWSAFAFMGLMGVTYGFASTLFGALWPDMYGLKNLGAIRAMTVAVGVLSTAVGPGLTGLLIDRGVSYPAQIVVMGIYCACAGLLMIFVSRKLRQRVLSSPDPSDSPA